MRRVMSREEAERCLESAGSVSPAEDGGEPYRTEALREQDAGMLLRCLKAVKLRPGARGRRLLESDRKFVDRAEKLLYGELAAALDRPPEEIKSEVEARFSGRSRPDMTEKE